ncbi:hypothetical protein FA13DRAFT_228708 [Coprinellus micaceus]|uniref:C2 NT-type domain-containing protein n=1 Tax=Coprinellus micaceus TaxID=71717 RepID=A0A4Y7TF71_COPMI|nr:hypothetical protein FA13DRAFT_228708 [Coprinellus micaceus]
MDPAAHDGDVTMGAQSTISSTATTPTPSNIQRQNSNPSTTSRSRPRNVRGLSLAPTPISHTTSSSSYTSLGESASVIAAQRGGLSATPGTPRLNAAAISRPGTPSLVRALTPLLGPPRTPGVGYAPLTPATPAGVVFSPNTPLYSPNALPPSKTAKLKSQLTSFLPARHTYFHAKITVEQLSSVPFVGGQFGVRWKFKNVHRHSAAQAEEGAHEEGQGIFGRMTSKSKGGSAKDKGKAREHPEANEFGGFHAQHQDSIASTATSSSMDTTTTSGSSSSATWSSTSMSSMGSNSSVATKTTPSTNLSRNFYSPYASASTTTMSPNSREAQYGPSQYLFNVTPAADGPSPSTTSTPSDPSSSLLFSPNAQSFSSNAAHGPTGVLSPMSPAFSVVSPTVTVMAQGRAINGNSTAPSGGTSQPAQIGHLSTARGMTRYLPLKDHSITFNFPLEAIVKMDVNRSATTATSETGDGSEGGLGLGAPEPNPYDPHSQSSTSISSMMAQANQQAKPNLQPSPLKLVVMQRVVPDDPGSVPQNPRLGAVSINLAEYVGKGKVERRFLLKESKVNATLKLAIEVNYMSGYQGYIAPPLPKAEIQGGIEGFLKQHDTLLTKKKVKDDGCVGGRQGRSVYGTRKGCPG